ncbi:MAG: TPM domain-containing protein [Burkholderiales bacterium]|nr:TPM domain-containing protein [Burkholderiales bacterium]
MLSIQRTLRHLMATRWQLRRAFPQASLDAIEQEIRTCEAMHTGEIRFAIEEALSGLPLYANQSARERAIDVFSHLRIWDTEHRNGVLIYLLFADRSVEIVADRGVHAKTGAPEWERICRKMESAFRAKQYEQGALDGIREVNRLLKQHFPANGADSNELPDKVVILDSSVDRYSASISD